MVGNKQPKDTCVISLMAYCQESFLKNAAFGSLHAYGHDSFFDNAVPIFQETQLQQLYKIHYVIVHEVQQVMQGSWRSVVCRLQYETRGRVRRRRQLDVIIVISGTQSTLLQYQTVPSCSPPASSPSPRASPAVCVSVARPRRDGQLTGRIAAAPAGSSSSQHRISDAGQQNHVTWITRLTCRAAPTCRQQE